MIAARTRRAAAGLAALAVLASAGAGCGSDKEGSYRAASRRAASDFRQSVARASAKIPQGSSLRQRVAGLEAYKASVDRLASKLASLDPPAKVKQLNDQAVSGLHALSGDLARFETAAKADDRTGAQAVAVRLAADQLRLRKVLDAIDAKLSG